MNDLEKARQEIDEIDASMAVLFEKRMDAVLRIKKYKKENGLSITDKQREAEIISRRTENIKNIAYKPLYKRFIENVIKLSKKLQKS